MARKIYGKVSYLLIACKIVFDHIPVFVCLLEIGCHLVWLLVVLVKFASSLQLGAIDGHLKIRQSGKC